MKTIDSSIQLLVLLLVLCQTSDVFARQSERHYPDQIETSEQLVAAVLQVNPELEIARATWHASVASIKQQSSLDDPQFQYGIAPLTINRHQSDVGQRFELSQTIPFPGKLSTRSKIAEYRADIKQYSITTLQLLLATKAKTLFADWYFIHQAIAINRVNQTLLQDFGEIALSRYRTGKASKQDVLRAEVEKALLDHQAIVLQRQRKTILAALNTLLNRDVDRPLPVPEQLPDISELPDFEQLKLKAMQSRSELKAMAIQINLEKTRESLAALDYYPDLKLSVGYNSLWNNQDKRFNIGISMAIPLGQGKRRAAERAARANRQQAIWRKIDLQASILEELTVAYAHTEESLYVLRLYRQKLSALADDNLAAAKADYSSGNGDFLTLISSEKNRMQTQLQTEQARADVHRRFAQLEQALGSVEPLPSLWREGRLSGNVESVSQSSTKIRARSDQASKIRSALQTGRRAQ